MHLTRLVVDNFRNLRHVELLPAEGLNIIFGDNGSGKTSLLEAVSALSRGYSFRSRKFTQLINDRSGSFTLFADLVRQGQMRKIGISRPKSGASVFKVDGQTVRSAGELAALLPVQVIDAQSFQLLEGGPGARRRFLDWLVFHVKQDYGRAWQSYARSVKQRNALLRRANIRPSELKAWDIEIVRYGRVLDTSRQATLEQFLPCLNIFLQESGLTTGRDLTIDYLPGWDTSTDLNQQVSDSFERDRRQGFTSLGPHKSDLKIRCNQTDAVAFLSRGQQKTLISALYMAQVATLHGLSGARCLVLVDDLPAELDKKNRQVLGSWLASSQCQLFVTGVDLDSVTTAWCEDTLRLAKLFHVKHGETTEYTHAPWSE